MASPKQQTTETNGNVQLRIKIPTGMAIYSNANPFNKGIFLSIDSIPQCTACLPGNQPKSERVNVIALMINKWC
jgi:hypothetical protein